MKRRKGFEGLVWCDRCHGIMPGKDSGEVAMVGLDILAKVVYCDTCGTAILTEAPNA